MDVFSASAGDPPPPALCQQHQGFCGQTGTTWETRATGFCAETGALTGGWGSALLGACGRGRGRGSLQSCEPGSPRAGGGLWRGSRGAAPVKVQGCDTGWVASRRGPSGGRSGDGKGRCHGDEMEAACGDPGGHAAPDVVGREGLWRGLDRGLGTEGGVRTDRARHLGKQGKKKKWVSGWLGLKAPILPPMAVCGPLWHLW